jgi:hypothetical protein
MTVSWVNSLLPRPRWQRLDTTLRMTRTDLRIRCHAALHRAAAGKPVPVSPRGRHMATARIVGSNRFYGSAKSNTSEIFKLRYRFL